ncbi:hypothetical protein MTR67_031734 [Solanum verrucosum]|uniref:Integrase catalytic domain-containing protein n=1 Tax=Solanum verrucosum TaxID=315347 RepID=A0AAF0U369_SOLVR|nr:hypothetical protein MTR67_031734 [Solanum verrucosum]
MNHGPSTCSWFTPSQYGGPRIPPRVVDLMTDRGWVRHPDPVDPMTLSEDEHTDHLRIVLQVLKDQQLFSKFSKYEFWLRFVAFLGHIISGKGINVDPKKTNTFKSLPRPLSPSDIGSFLGLASHFSRFFKGFSLIASLLTTLTQNKVKFLWSEACEKSLQDLKDRLTSTLVLTLLEGSDVFVVYCGALRIELGVGYVEEGGVIVNDGSESSFVSDVKTKKGLDPISVELKEVMLKKAIEAFSQGGGGVLRYQGHLCVPNVDDLKEEILLEAHFSRYSIHPVATKIHHDLRVRVATEPVTELPDRDVPEPERNRAPRAGTEPEPGRTGTDYAKLYLRQMVRFHGVRLSIISDRGTQFTSQFWKSFQKGFGTCVKLSTTFHPQTDGQAERTIQTLQDMLRACAIDFKGN